MTQYSNDCTKIFSDITPINISLSSFNQIWKFYAGHPCTIDINPNMFERLFPLTNLIFSERQVNLYQVYLHTRPQDENKDDYQTLVENSTAILINLLWNYIRDFLAIPNSRWDEASKQVINATNLKTLDQIEHDVQLLYDDVKWLKKKCIFNSYGFKTPTDKVNILRSLSRFGYDRRYAKYIPKDAFQRIFINDRRQYNFVNAILNTVKHDCVSYELNGRTHSYHNSQTHDRVHSLIDDTTGVNDFVRQVLIDYLIKEFASISFRWDGLRKINYIEDILVTTDEESQYSQRELNDIDIVKNINWTVDSFRKVSPGAAICEYASNRCSNSSTYSQYPKYSSHNTGRTSGKLRSRIKLIDIEECDGVSFFSDDGEYHDLIETDSNWKPLRQPKYKLRASHCLDHIIQFRDEGVIYLRDNHNPNTIRLIVHVVRSNNIDKCFDKVLSSRKLLPLCPSTNYDFHPDFRRKINQYILAEATLRRLTWNLLRVFRLSDHDTLVQTLSIAQLKLIHMVRTMCDIVSINDNSPEWETLISNIGNVLLSRALQSLSKCSNDSNIDANKRALTKWYMIDHNYALVALCNVLKPDGSVDICSLIGQIKARSTSGIRCSTSNIYCSK